MNIWKTENMESDDVTVFGCKFNVPIFTLYEDRLATFLVWPRQMSPDKYSLSAAGLFYTGEGDIVRCFSCGVKLSQWKITDKAFSEHRKWSPDFLYLKMIGYGKHQTEDDLCCALSGGHPGIKAVGSERA